MDKDVVTVIAWLALIVGALLTFGTLAHALSARTLAGFGAGALLGLGQGRR